MHTVFIGNGRFQKRVTAYANPQIPTGQTFRNRLRVASRFDWDRLRGATRVYAQDPKNPTLRRPDQVVANRARRLVRHFAATATGMFEDPVPGEHFVLFPLHFQPEATTLVLAPYYLNQVALVEDIAKSLPAGVRLYVKEHLVSRGRRPLSFYKSLRAIPGVRLIKSAVDPEPVVCRRGTGPRSSGKCSPSSGRIRSC